MDAVTFVARSLNICWDFDTEKLTGLMYLVKKIAKDIYVQVTNKQIRG